MTVATVARFGSRAREYAARHLPAATLLMTGALVLLVFGRSSAYGLFSDDYQWIIGAWHYDVRRTLALPGGRFFRPVMDLYFYGAVNLCGWSAPCFHWLSIAVHLLTTLAVAALVATLSRSRAIGALAGVFFAAQPGPVEAVVWVSAVSEVLATLWAVLTLILFRHARRTGRSWSLVLSILTSSAALLTHEAGVVVLPLMALMTWRLPPGDRSALPAWTWILYAIPLLGYAGIAAAGSTSNPVVTAGEYGVGGHIGRNIVHAVLSLTAGGRGMISVVLAGTALAWAVLLAPRLVQFFALWFVIALLPFSLFRDGLASRYTYPAAVGLAAITAALVWWARGVVWHRPRVWRIGWAVVVLFLVARHAAFASRNVRIGQDDRVPYEAYAARVRALHPNPEPGSTLDVPPPPTALDMIYVEPLLRWTYRDPSLTVRITSER